MPIFASTGGRGGLALHRGRRQWAGVYELPEHWYPRIPSDRFSRIPASSNIGSASQRSKYRPGIPVAHGRWAGYTKSTDEQPQLWAPVRRTSSFAPFSRWILASSAFAHWRIATAASHRLARLQCEERKWQIGGNLPCSIFCVVALEMSSPQAKNSDPSSGPASEVQPRSSSPQAVMLAANLTDVRQNVRHCCHYANRPSMSLPFYWTVLVLPKDQRSRCASCQRINRLQNPESHHQPLIVTARQKP